MNIITALRAGYAFFYAKTQTGETDRFVKSIGKEISEFKYRKGENPYSVEVWDYEFNQDVEGILFGMDEKPAGTVLIAKNLHWFFSGEYGGINKLLVTFVLNRAEQYTMGPTRKAIIIVGAEPMETAIPEVLKEEFVPIKPDLPTENDIGKELDFIIQSATSTNPDFNVPTDETIDLAVRSAKGMGQRDIRNAFAYTVIEKGAVDPATISSLKAKNIESVSGLKIGSSKKTFDNIKGYGNLKRFTLGTIKNPLSKGIMLLGPPGTGKTVFAQALGNETGMLMVEMEIAKMFGGLVGDSEKMMAAALDAIRACAPCVVLVDEIEKALAGMKGGQSGDGGTTQRSLAQFLKFLSDERPEGIYVIATCNDITSLPPEWVRPGRWDSAPFFIDLPNSEIRSEILSYYKEIYGVNGKVGNLEGWSGAELESCCRIAAMMGVDLNTACDFIVPISLTMETEIAQLRQWSKNRTIPAESSKTEKAVSSMDRALEL